MIISLVNQKGGVGKTTMAINMAYCFSRIHDKRTLLIDADRQASCLQWQAIRDDRAFDVVHHPEADLHRTIGELGTGYRTVIVDCPPGTGDTSLSVLLASHLAIIPISPSPLDMWSSEELGSLVMDARKHNRKLKGKLLISRKIVGTTPARDAREALERYRMEIFKTEIAQRIAYVKAFIAGQSVLEYEPNSEASREIQSLCEEITE